MSIAEKHLTHIAQIGFVYPDIDPIIKAMKDKLGIEPTKFGVTPEEGDKFYRGKKDDLGCRMAFYNFANIELEFISPVKGEHSVWQDFLDSGRQGLHHIRFDIADHEGLKEDFAQVDIPLYMYGPSTNMPGHTWAYWDTEPSLGWLLETLNAFEDINK